MIHAIILAAGLSRRMGAQKLLLPYAGRTLIGQVAGQVAASGVDRIVAVTRGCNALAGRTAEVAEALAGLGVMRLAIVVNPDAEGDMLSSVRCGLLALPGECEGYLVVLGDQPTITAGLINRMIAAFGESDPAVSRAAGRGIVVPAHQHRRGHPILFAARYRREILAGFEGVGLRGLLAAHAEDILELHEPDPAILTDVDRPEDYLDALGARRIPDPTTEGDFCRRFDVSDIETLMEAINEVRLGVFRCGVSRRA